MCLYTYAFELNTFWSKSQCAQNFALDLNKQLRFKLEKSLAFKTI